MKIDRVDVAHEEIFDNCEEYLVLSVQAKGEDEYISRAYLSTDGDILKEILIDEMNNSELIATFMQEVINDYKQQKLQ
tara:strand:- start:441 stop:674 length:234 start_codon:yes stop_codon:yes gene_type:complete